VTAPDVVYLHTGLTVGSTDDLYDDTAHAWDRRTAEPIAPEPDLSVEPLTHREGCFLAHWPDLADLCPCTKNARYVLARRQHAA
jgi:hypothetical protein